MKNFFTKAFVCAGVMASALVLSNVAVFAESTVSYNFSTSTYATTGDNAFDYDGKTSISTKNKATKEFDSTVSINNQASWGYLTYSGDNAVTNNAGGTLAGAEFTSAYVNANGLSGTKALIEIKGVKPNDLIEVYWARVGNTQGGIGGSGTLSLTKTKASGGTNIGTSTSSTGLVRTVFEVGSTAVSSDGESVYICPSDRAAIFGLAITTGRVAATTVDVTGNVSTDLTTSGTIMFNATDGSGASASTTVNSDGSIETVALKADTEYAISLASNEGYLASRYAVDPASLTIDTSESTTINVTSAGQITNVWDFSKEDVFPAKTFNSTTGTYKGLSINATKFDVQPSSKRVQANKDTVVTVPDVNTATQKVVVYDKDGNEDTTNFTIDGATITALNENGSYIYKIAVITLLDDNVYTSTGGNGLVVVKDNNVYAIGKIELADLSSKDTVTLTVGNVSYTGKTEVFKQVKVDDVSVTGDAVDGVYYLGVKVNNVPSNAAAESLANLITLA